MQLMQFECRGQQVAQPAPLAGASDNVPGVLNVAGKVATVIDFFKFLPKPSHDEQPGAAFPQFQSKRTAARGAACT
jgi:chemotaxis signal transduction protein